MRTVPPAREFRERELLRAGRLDPANRYRRRLRPPKERRVRR